MATKRQQRDDNALAVQEAVKAAREQRAITTKEYGTYVAVEDIDILGTRAFNTGDAVPIYHVESGLVETASVAKVDTKAAAAAVEEATATDVAVIP